MCGAAHLSDCVEVRGQFLGISSLLPGVKLRFTLFGDRSPHPLSHPGWAALNQVSIFHANKFLGVYSQRKRTRRFCQWEQTIRKKRPGVETRLHMTATGKSTTGLHRTPAPMHKDVLQKLCSVRADIQTGTGLTLPLLALKTGCPQTCSAPVSVPPGLCLEALSPHSLQEIPPLRFPP